MTVVTKDTIQPSSGQALTIKDEGGTASITVATNGEATFAENIKITANKGINFSANIDDEIGAGSLTGEILDDYEYGTWVPQLTEDSYNYTMNSDNGGRYVKIGNLVHISALVRPNDNVHGNGNYNGQAKITGLPFTSATGARNGVGFSIGKFNLDDDTVISLNAYMSDSTTKIELYRGTNSHNSAQSLTVSNFNGNGSSNAYYIYISGTYYTD